MLIKDGKEFNLDAPENKEELEAFLAVMPEYDDKHHISIKYADELITWDHVNGKENKPANRGLPLRQVINRKEKGNQTWIYCENYELHQATGSIVNRTPWRFSFNGIYPIPYTKKDLAFFLWISPFCGNGENAMDRAIYQFEDREGDASRVLQKERLQSRVKFLVLNAEEDGGLSDEKVLEYCIAYRLPGKMGINEARTSLFGKLTRLGDQGYNKFLSLMENPQEKKMLVTIKKAKDLGILKCSGIKFESGGNNQAWKIFNREGDAIKVFAKHIRKSQGVTDHELFLMRALNQDPDILKEIELAIKVQEPEIA